MFDSPPSEREGFPEKNPSLSLVPSMYGTGSAREVERPLDKGREDGGAKARRARGSIRDLLRA